ncbi:MAG: SDR family NAD(P)-dependent oxidoreductase [bacterium]
MNSKVLVTGGCGFIGVNLCKLLLKKSYPVIVLDNFSQRNPDMVYRICDSPGASDFEVQKGDVRNREDIQQVMGQVEFVVHLAASTNVRESIREPEIDMEHNSMGTFKILECARKSSSVQKVIFASSNAAVGNVQGAVDETCVPEPISPYGASKLHGEALCKTYYHTYDLDTTVFRFANVYGPYSKHKSSVITKFITRAQNNLDLPIYGDGNQTRDFIHVDDIARAIVKTLESDRPSGEIYQVATGRETAINKLAETILQLASNDGFGVEIEYEDPRPGEIHKNFSSIDKIERELNWNPEVDLQEGLTDLWNWFIQESMN